MDNGGRTTCERGSGYAGVLFDPGGHNSRYSHQGQRSESCISTKAAGLGSLDS